MAHEFQAVFDFTKVPSEDALVFPATNSADFQHGESVVMTTNAKTSMPWAGSSFMVSNDIPQGDEDCFNLSTNEERVKISHLQPLIFELSYGAGKMQLIPITFFIRNGSLGKEIGMGNPQSHPATVRLSCSHTYANVGEHVQLRYTSNLSATDLQSGAISLELITPSGQKVYEKELTERSMNELDIRIPPVPSGTILTVRIINKIILENDGTPTVYGTRDITITKTIISPVPVTSNGVSLSLQSPPFCDSPQVISIARSGGIRPHDYLEFHVNSVRASWEWCRGKSAIDFGIHCSSFDEEVTVKFFEDGGLFSAGKQVATMKYTLRNPVEELSLSSLCPEVCTELRVQYRLSPEHSQRTAIVARLCGVRVSHHLVSTATGECLVPVPRIPGQLSIACVANGQGEHELAMRSVSVSDRERRSRFNLTFTGYAADHRILGIRRGQRFEVHASGDLLTAADKVVIVKTEDLFRSPSHTSLVFSAQQSVLGATGVCSFTVSAEGMYHVCLALTHGSALLLGEYCSLIVSDRIGLNSHPEPVALPPPPRPPLPHPYVTIPQPPAPATATGFMCAVCLDKTVCMKFDPCKHVVTCEDCCGLLVNTRGRQCPVCRKTIKSSEKVFLS